jgi:vancomycin resistance protein YoaR
LLKSKFLRIALVLIGAMLMSGGFVIHSYNTSVSDDRILNSIYINGFDVGGLNKDEARDAIRQNNSFKNLNVVYSGSDHVYSLAELGCEFDIDQAIDQALQVGRNEDFIKNISDYVGLKFLDDSRTFEVKPQIPQDIEDRIYEDIKSKIERKPENASISIGSSIDVKKGEEGVKINRDEFRKAIYDAIKPNVDVTVKVPIESVTPEITSDELSRIDGIIGTYRTNFSPNVEGRNENIRLSAQYMNNYLLMPGEVFSYNKVTRLKTVSNGYKNATVIVNGEIEEGLGGGVCQVSSTLYNSVLYSGLEIVQRRPHSIPSSYVNYGRDAVVSDNAIDFKFKNNYDFPVYLKTYVGSSSVTVTIYGNTGSVPEIDIISNVVSVKPRAVKYIDDPNLEKGKEVVKTKGRDEIRSETYVVINGVKKLVSKDRYPSQTKVIMRGTKEEV